jgi:hypothetical protein
MLAIDRWRNWQPSLKKFDDSLGCEPPEPSKLGFGGFEGSRSEQTQNISEKCVRSKESEMETAMREEMSQAATELPRCTGDHVADASRFETLTPSASIPLHDLAKWREPLSRWLDSVCVCSPRDFGGLNRLHIAFCEWEVQRGEVPSTRDIFKQLLTEKGFLIGEVAGTVLVSGLTFREDCEVYQ